MVDDLAASLAEGVAALRQGHAERAVTALAKVATSPDLEQADDLRDIWARANSLYAQALLQAGRAGEARVPLRRAMDALVQLGDPEGLETVRALESEIGAAMNEAFQAQARRRELRALAQKPWEVLVEGVPEPARRAAVLIERAGAALDVGRPAEAEQIADRALEDALAIADVRHIVLARLVLARATTDPRRAREQLSLALSTADAANEATLVGSVAKAAAELGVEIAPVEGP